MPSLQATAEPLRAPASPANATFLRHHLLYPLSIALLTITALMVGGGDRWLADQFYRLEGHQWALQHAWLANAVIHKGGKWLSASATLLVMVMCVHAGRQPHLRAWRTPLLYVLLAVTLGTGVVTLLKSITHMDCPWDLVRYGGSRDYIGLFSARPAGMPVAACFPAGHASAGYAWVCLYFAALMVRPRWRWHGLAVGLLAGALFGATQQLRGAHFLSHDVATLAVCWTVSAGLYLCGTRLGGCGGAA